VLAGLLAINTEQGLVHPYVLVTWGNQESVSGCQEQVFPDLWNSLEQVAGMNRDEEVRRVRQVARPYIPTRGSAVRRMPQAVDGPAPTRAEQRAGHSQDQVEAVRANAPSVSQVILICRCKLWP